MKHTLSGYVEPTAEKIAREMGLALVDVELVKENTGRFLRFFIDTPKTCQHGLSEVFLLWLALQELDWR